MPLNNAALESLEAIEFKPEPMPQNIPAVQPNSPDAAEPATAPEATGAADDKGTAGEYKLSIFGSGDLSPEYMQKLLSSIVPTDPDNMPEPPEALLSLNGNVIMRRGTMLILAGKAGCRKTSLATLLCADAVAPNVVTNSPISVPRPLRVLYIDPEQAEYDTAVILKRLQTLTKQHKPNVFVIPLVRLDFNDIAPAVELATQMYQPDIIVVDNVMQMARGATMDLDVSEILCRNIRRLAVEYNAGFMGIIHDNENSATKGVRGHGGNEARREAEMIVHLQAFDGDDFDFSLGEWIKTRWEKPAAFGIYYDKENNCPAYLTAEECAEQNPDAGRQKQKPTTKREANKNAISEFHQLLAEHIRPDGLTPTEFYAMGSRLYSDLYGKEKTRCENSIKKTDRPAMLKANLITEANGKIYRNF